MKLYNTDQITKDYYFYVNVCRDVSTLFYKNIVFVTQILEETPPIKIIDYIACSLAEREKLRAIRKSKRGLSDDKDNFSGEFENARGRTRFPAGNRLLYSFLYTL